MGFFDRKSKRAAAPAEPDPHDGTTETTGTAPPRWYVEAKDSNGVWFVVSAHATEAEAQQPKLDWDRAEPTPSRIVQRPEGDETPEQDDTSSREDLSEHDEPARVKR